MTVSLLVGSLGNWLGLPPGRYAEALRQTIAALSSLDDPPIEAWTGAGPRNAFVWRARGEAIAFLEAGCIPSPGWLRGLRAELPGGAAGHMHDPTGRLRPRTLDDDTYLPLGASVFRRDAFARIGGYDERIRDAVLAQRDLCARLVRGGSVIRQHEGLPVFEWLPSRESVPFAQGWKTWLESRIVAASLDQPPMDALRETKDWLARPEELVRAGLGVSPALREDFDWETAEALASGIELAGAQRTGAVRGEFAPIAFSPAPDPLTVCFLSREYPPGVVGGIGRMTAELARALAAPGHRVHVVTLAPDAGRSLRCEDAVWVHRIVPGADAPPPPEHCPMPAAAWRYAWSAALEIERIALDERIDIVDAPVWEAEGIAVAGTGSFRLVTNLETPSRVQARWNPDAAAMAAAERAVVERSDGVRAVSAGVLGTFEQEYGIGIDPSRAAVIAPGVAATPESPEAARNAGVEVLFAGRFERRKGIDVLLEAMPALLEEFPDVRFVLAGRDAEPLPGTGRRRTDAFRSRWPASRVHFAGEVPDRELAALYRACDLFVAPSLYESFGFVFLDAMRASKPVVACRAGGVPEVVEDGATGLLVEPGDVDGLRDALARLIADPALRRAMGRAGRVRFEERFTAQAAAARTAAWYRSVMHPPTLL